jgi:hypothetical protein
VTRSRPRTAGSSEVSWDFWPSQRGIRAIARVAPERQPCDVGGVHAPDVRDDRPTHLGRDLVELLPIVAVLLGPSLSVLLLGTFLALYRTRRGSWAPHLAHPVRPAANTDRGVLPSHAARLRASRPDQGTAPS